MKFSPTIIFSDVRTFFTMTRAIIRGQYKMPWKTLLWVLVCAVYFLSPIDALPDIVPLLGFADDGAFIIYVLLLIHQDLTSFRQTCHPQKTVIEAEIIKEKETKK